MKMNFKYAMMMVATLLLGFSSCSNDDESGAGNTNNGRGELTSMNIVASQGGGISTYAINTSPVGDEGVIKTATTYIFDAAGVLEVVQGLTVGGGGSSANATGVTITTGPKTFYVVANANAGLSAILTGPAVTPNDPAVLNEAAFVKVLANGATDMTVMSDIAIPTAGAGTGFLMTIAEGGKQQTLNPGVTNNVSVKIGRAFAKTNVEFNPATVAYESTLGGKLTNVEYMVRNNKNNAYNQAVYNGSQLEGYWYNKWTTGPTPAINAGDFFIEGGTLAAGGLFPAGSQHFATATLADGTDANYAMENANSAPLYGTASFIQIGGEWVLDATTDVYKDDNTVLGQGNGALTTGDFYRIVEFDADPTIVPPTVGHATKVIREISNKYYDTAPTAPTVAAEIAAFTGAAPVNANVGILKYEGGRMYFSVYLTNPDAVSTTPTNETFMVERNKYYYVTVKSINRLGSNTAEITNPGEIITTTVDIDAAITVADWDNASSNADL